MKKFKRVDVAKRTSWKTKYDSSLDRIIEEQVKHEETLKELAKAKAEITKLTFEHLATKRELQATKRELIKVGMQYAAERVGTVQAEYRHAKDLADFSIEEIEAEDAEIDKLVAESIAAAAKK